MEPKSKKRTPDGAAENYSTRSDTMSNSPVSSTDFGSLPLPPDGGYGWVVVGVTFIGFGILDGMPGVTGVLMPHLLEEFNQGRAKTALASSLFVGMYLMLGPFVGVLIQLVGCRPVTMVGGLISAIGIFASAFAPTIEVFILTSGAIAGLGASMFFLPFCVMPGYYFEKRRAIALGISSSGAGTGLIVMPQVAALLLSNLNWRSVVILLAGLVLQIVALGALLRPLGSKGNRPKAQIRHDKNNMENATLDKTAPNSTSGDSGTVMEFDTLPNEPLLSGEQVQLSSREPAKQGNTWIQSCYAFKSHNDTNYKVLQNSNIAERNIRDIKRTVPVAPPTNAASPKNTRSVTNRESKTTYANSCYEFSKIPDIANQKFPSSRGQVDRNQIRQDLLRPFSEHYFTGSVADLPEFQSQPDVTSYLASLRSLPDAYNTTGSGGCCQRATSPLVETLKNMLDLRILLDPSFLLIGLAAFGIQLGYFVPVLFMADHTSTLGLTAGQSASLVAAFGITNSLGRFISGLLSNGKYINPLHIHAVSLVIAGASCCLGVTYCTSLVTLLIYISIYGLCLAMFVPIHTILLVKYLGLGRLTPAYGFLAMMKGISNIIGPSISGILIDTTGSFEMAFYFGGGTLMISGLIPYFLPLVSRLRRKQELLS